MICQVRLRSAVWGAAGGTRVAVTSLYVGGEDGISTSVTQVMHT